MVVNEFQGLNFTGCEANITVNATNSGEPGGQATASNSCQWPTGGEYLEQSLDAWQRNQGVNFGALIGLLCVYYVLALIVFTCRKKILH